VGGTMRGERTDQRTPVARRLRAQTTEAERKLWQHLRQWPERAAHFRRQAAIGPYFADFACHSNRIVIELDGGHHASGIQARNDSIRDAFFKSKAYRVLRFWNHDVMKNVEGVLTVVADAIENKDPPPLTPPRRFAGGGEPRGTGDQ
jgi:very-short-patch-repair endonuclease